MKTLEYQGKDYNQKMTKTTLKQKKIGFKESDLGINPYRTGFVIPVVKRTREETISDEKDVNVGKGKHTVGRSVTSSNSYFLDQRQKAYMYTAPEIRKYVGSMLSSAGRDLYLWVMFEITSSKEYVWINLPRYQKEFGVAINTYKSAMNNLVKNGVLYPIYEQPNMFWINPRFFFKGSVTDVFSDCLELQVSKK